MTDADRSILTEAFWAYERALMANDLAELDRLFAPGPGTLRGDANGLLVGHDQISAFRGGRKVPADGKPWRRIVQTHVQAIDADHALIVAVTELASGGRGQQTQLWGRIATPTGSDWKVTAAHVSVPAPALDTRIWRSVGDPLVAGQASGPLSGQSVAIKDLYAVAGHSIGAGNPAWLAEAPIEPSHAWAVERLLGAGADVRGIARCDEFAYALGGTNPHYGTPPNPVAPYRLPGGSSSGAASAVSLGHASIGLGTDTGGSIRVPAAYQGLYSLRATHGAVPLDGVLALAPTFDAVGWLTREPSLLAEVGEVLLGPVPTHRAAPEPSASPLVVVPQLLAEADAEVAEAIRAWIADLPVEAAREQWDVDLAAWRHTYVTFTAHQAWDVRGDWLAAGLAESDSPTLGALGALGEEARARFAAAQAVSEEEAEAAATAADLAGEAIRAFVADRIVILPAATSVAPHPGDEAQAALASTLALTCLASLGGLPALTIPLSTASGLPCGVSLIAAPGRDRDLLSLARVLPGGRLRQ